MQLTDSAIPACVIDSIKNLVNPNTKLWLTECIFYKVVNNDININTINHNNNIDKLGKINYCLWQYEEIDGDTIYNYILFLITDINYPYAYTLISKNPFYTNTNIKLIFATTDQFNTNCDRLKQLWLGNRKL